MKKKLPDKGFSPRFATSSGNNSCRSFGVLFSVMAVIALAFVSTQGLRTDSAESLTTAATTEQFTLDTTNSILVTGTNQLFNQNDVGAQLVIPTMKGDMNRAVCMVNDSLMPANTISGQNVNGLSAATYKSTTNTYIALAATKLNIQTVAQITTKASVVPAASYLAIRNEDPTDVGLVFITA